MEKTKLFILNGSARCGKGTFVSVLKNRFSVFESSTVDVIKDVCKKLGWNGIKDDKGRLALSDFKDLATKHFDHSYNYIKGIIDFCNVNNIDILTVDSREPEEIERFVKDFGFKTILIKRNNFKHVPNNHADQNVEDYTYDYVIENNGTLEEYYKIINDFIDKNIL